MPQSYQFRCMKPKIDFAWSAMVLKTLARDFCVL